MAVSRMAVLPDYVLVRIFNTSIACSSHHRATLRNVCRLWRTIIDAHPAYWRCVHFSCALMDGTDREVNRLRTTLEQCRLAMTRSESHSLDVRIVVDIDRPFFGAASIPWHPFHRQVIAGLRALLVDAAPRTRTLLVEGSPCVVRTILLGTFPPIV